MTCKDCTSVPEDCPKKMSGYLPYYGLHCDGCICDVIERYNEVWK